MRRRSSIGLLAVVAMASVFVTGRASAQPRDLYVSTNATASGSPWNSWSTAFTNVQAALDEAAVGDTIYLAGHTFYLTNQINWIAGKNDLRIIGGFAATNDLALPGDYDSDAWPSVIERSVGTTRLLQVTGVTNGTLEHITFHGGSHDQHGGGLHVSACEDLALLDCVIEDSQTTAAHGGGLYVQTTDMLLISNCVFRGNTVGPDTFRVDTYGGAVSFGSGMGTVTILESLFDDNAAYTRERTAHGNAIYIGSGTVDLRDSVLQNNRTTGRHITQRGTVYNTATLRLFNCLIKGNSAGSVNSAGGAVFGAGGSLSIVNSTLAYNPPVAVERNSGTLAITNSILWGNAKDVSGAIGLTHCNLQSGVGNGDNGNISADPLFEYGFRLADISPCIDAGTNSAEFWGLDGHTTRTDGTPDSGIVDLGYHYPGGSGVDLTYADLYVAGDGSDVGNSGTAVEEPFRTISHALSLAIDGSRIHIGAGHYTNGLESMPLTRAGIDGIELLGAGAGVTILNGMQQQPVMVFSNHNGRVRIRDVTLTGGAGGGGLYLLNCGEVSIEACVVTNNLSTDNGGGMRFSQCPRITITDSDISTNCTTGLRGGGLSIDTAADRVTILNSIIHSNLVGKSSFRNATYGGGIAIFSGIGTVTVSNSLIFDNTAYVRQQSAFGGALSLESGNLTFERTVISGNRITGSYITDRGAVYNTTTLTLRNSLMKNNAAQSALYAGGGTVDIENCTVVSNPPVAIQCAAGMVTGLNSIFWDNDTDVDGLFENVTFSYTCSQSGFQNGLRGNNAFNPLFVDSVYFHLQSIEGDYRDGYFSDGWWSAGSAANGPLIDAGDPAGDYSLEPEPDGDRVNMGVYGNTETASLTDTSSVFEVTIIENTGATVVGHRSARLNARVVDTGGQLPDCGFTYWVAGSGVTSSVPVGLQQDAFFVDVSGLQPGTTYEFAAYGVNSAGTGWSGVNSYTTHSGPTELYVATSGDNTLGTRWSTAYTDLQTTIDLAEPGDAIHVAGETIVRNRPVDWIAKTNLAVIGGYEAADDSQQPGTPDPEQWPTVWTTEGTERVLVVVDSVSGRVENVTITGGAISGSVNGGGVHISDSSAFAFLACSIVSNAVGPATATSRGGGLYAANSSVWIFDSLIQGNRALAGGHGQGYGGGLHLASGSLTVSNSIIRENSAENSGSAGGGVHVQNGAMSLVKCILTTNDVTAGAGTGSGAAARHVAGMLLLRHCLLHGNTASPGQWGGIRSSAGSVVMENCTVAGNIGGGVSRDGGTFAITNCIVWGHAPADLTNFPINVEGHLTDFSHNLYETAYTDDVLIDMHAVEGCIVGEDPLFIDAAAGDYRLQPVVSPAIDAGLNFDRMTDATDLAGSKRILFGHISATVDMGAYEAPPVPGSMFMVR